MSQGPDQPKQDLEALLGNPEYADHPLLEALQDLYEVHQDQLRKIERITRISDKVQFNSKLETVGLIKRFEKSIKKLERIARISDRYQSVLQELNAELHHASTHDHLTNVGNRQFMTEYLKAVAEQPEPFSVVLLDIDHFKNVNDTYGHAGGDATLIAIAEILKSKIRGGDAIARWGGEEFLVLFPGASLDIALANAERLRSSLEGQKIQFAESEIRITGSFGVCEYQKGESIHQTISRADEAMYLAKQQGRNCCVTASALQSL
jgi:diguanylate cyclase